MTHDLNPPAELIEKWTAEFEDEYRKGDNSTRFKKFNGEYISTPQWWAHRYYIKARTAGWRELQTAISKLEYAPPIRPNTSPRMNRATAEPSPAVAVPAKKALPDLMMASYHEAMGWNNCIDAMLSTHTAVAVPDGWIEAIEYVSELLKNVPDTISVIPTPKETYLLMDGKKIVNELLSTPTPPSAEQISPMEKDKAKNWDYYQELLKQNGFCGITDLLTKYHALERSIEQPDSAAPYVFFKKINGKDEWSSWNEFSDGSNGGKPLYEHPQAKSQRITEQDARDIFDCFVAYYGVETGPLDFECWKSGIGHALLAKLNENREPDCKAKIEDLQSTIECKDVEIDVLAAQKDELLALLKAERDSTWLDQAEHLNAINAAITCNAIRLPENKLLNISWKLVTIALKDCDGEAKYIANPEQHEEDCHVRLTYEIAELLTQK